MTRIEFLEKLREALENELDAQAVQENVNYYSSYITEEMGKGRAETDVTAELGDPWVIARSLIGVAESASESYGGGQDSGSSGGRTSSGRSSGGRSASGRQSYGSNGADIHVFGLDSWWKKLLLVLGIIGVVLIIIAVIGGIFSLLMPIIVPVVIIMMVVRLLGRRR